mmetsp:Transcript_65946/g.185613  ORF Transcript_65946/g.185613 Transcript_65946/m.185613 type:complete len:218 (+) Transcript_65946:1180-1833(+)
MNPNFPLSFLIVPTWVPDGNMMGCVADCATGRFIISSGATLLASGRPFFSSVVKSKQTRVPVGGITLPKAAQPEGRAKMSGPPASEEMKPKPASLLFTVPVITPGCSSRGWTMPPAPTKPAASAIAWKAISASAISAASGDKPSSAASVTESARGRPVLPSVTTEKRTRVPSGGIAPPRAAQAAGITNMSTPSWPSTAIKPNLPLSFLTVPVRSWSE